MKKALVLTVILAGCGQVGQALQNPGQPSAEVASTTQPTIEQMQLEPYDGPKARVAVYRFADQSAKGGGGYSRRTGWYTAEIGNGMADMLNDALLQSNRFIVLERQSLQDVLMEQDLGATGRIKKETAASLGEIEGAELLIKGSVTEFEPGSAGGQSGALLGGFGLPGAIIGGALGSVQQSHVAMIIQVVDAKSSRMLFSTTVEGKANDFDIGGMLGGFGGHVLGGAGLGVWQKTPVEKAIRVAILKGVQEISNKTPKTYYRHSAMQAAAIPPAATPSAGAAAVKPAVFKPQSNSPAAAAPLSSTAIVKVKSANLRDNPGTQGKVVATLKEGTKLSINAEEKDWYHIEIEDGTSGWISKSLTR
jgi:curli biogenesis system outer membrane secretion channel CsgG